MCYKIPGSNIHPWFDMTLQLCESLPRKGWWPVFSVSLKSILNEILFLFFSFNLYSILFCYHLVPLYHPPLSNHHTVVHVHESF